MKVINITTPRLSSADQHALYNGIDGIQTLRLYHALQPKRNPQYEHEIRCIPPILDMMRRGIKINKDKAHHEGNNLVNRMVELQDKFKRLTHLVCPGWEPNTRSDKQMKTLFYDWLKVPEVVLVKKGEAKVSLNKEALEKIKQSYIRAIPYANILSRLREYEKQLDILTKGLTSDNRWLFSFNVAGTETGRWSSSESPLYYGSNIQNIDPDLRHIFEADDGYTMGSFDLQGAEARGVAYLSGDENYIRAVESGDVHTMVAAMVYGIPPTVEYSSKILYGKLTYRDVSKRLTHGTSYGGKPPTLARIAKVDVKFVEAFQAKFYKNFPGIELWQRHTIADIMKTGTLTTPFGMSRKFFGRRDDESTWREAIAFKPQSMISRITAEGICNLYYNIPQIQLLANGHDAIIFQVPTPSLFELHPQIMKQIEITVPVTDIKGITRNMVIPFEPSYGMNWGKYHSTNNPNGLKKYVPSD